tara:strand:+ start:649 stop:1083 length:435 start_codon:yes stop_codon:yes gene_type:complete
MSKNKLIEQLLIRAEELNAEIKAVQSLIDLYKGIGDKYGVISEFHNSNSAILKEGQATNFKPKGNKSWEDYAVYLLGIKESAKAREIIQMAIAANPLLDKVTVKSAIRSKLSRLHRANKIEAEKSANKKDGYTYKIKKEPIGSS